MAKEPKKKYEIIDRELWPEPWDLMDEARETWHSRIEGCRIVLLWVNSMKPDRDGRLVLGRCHPVTEADRELHGYDRKISLNREAWETLERPQRLALIDHELCHIDVQVDKEGEPKLDGHGKALYRTVRHTIEEFHCVFRRHGCYKGDIATFAQIALEAGPDLPLFDGRERSASPVRGVMDAVRRFAASAPEGTSVNLTHNGETATITPEIAEEARRQLRSVKGGRA